ncbi:MAG: ribbon-helix-helix domain-containing protein [Spirirestis rafaelensis WJT71-NPBG6]|jgi:predicted transcriptional regulator|nr:ribbon-helix-helix domain-containing protein [Spirirestis rafaelensis WJT71-NPBG6]
MKSKVHRTFRLDKQVDVKLADVAKQTNITQSELIRFALDQYLFNTSSKK